MTPEEREYAVSIFDKSVVLANEVGPQIVSLANNSTPVVTTTAAILLSHFCITAKVSMYDAVDILMSAYKNLSEEEGSQV